MAQKEKKLVIKPVPRTAGSIPMAEGPPIKFDRIDLGVGPRPRLIVVLRGEDVRRRNMAMAALQEAFANISAEGTIAVWLPQGCDLEAYEVEP